MQTKNLDGMVLHRYESSAGGCDYVLVCGRLPQTYQAWLANEVKQRPNGAAMRELFNRTVGGMLNSSHGKDVKATYGTVLGWPARVDYIEKASGLRSVSQTIYTDSTLVIASLTFTSSNSAKEAGAFFNTLHFAKAQ